MTKKRVAILLAAMLLATQLFTGAIAYSDVADGEWYTDAANRWGYLLSDGDTLEPAAPITRAEFSHLVNSVMKFPAAAADFSDVDSSTPYSADIGALQAAGVLVGVGDGQFAPDRGFSRVEAVVIFANAIAVELAEGEALNFNDAATIPSWATLYSSVLNEGRYVMGDHNGNFQPNRMLTRAEALQIVENVATNYVNSTGTVNSVVFGNMVVNTPGAVIEDVTIEGDLIIAPGVGDGEVTLNNVNLLGTLYVRGGGENSIIITGTSALTRVIVETTVTTSIKVEGAATVGAVNIGDGGAVNLFGVFNAVNVNGIAPVTADATITNFNVSAANAVVTVSETTVITTMYVSMTAVGSAMDIGGTVGAYTNAAPASVTTITTTATVTTVTFTGAAVGSALFNEGEITELVAKSDTVEINNDGVIEDASLTAGNTITGTAAEEVTEIEAGSVNDAY